MHTVQILDLSSLEQRSTLRIHNNLDISLFNYGIVFSNLRLQCHAILVAMTTSTTDVDPQSDGVRFLLNTLTDFLFCIT